MINNTIEEDLDELLNKSFDNIIKNIGITVDNIEHIYKIKLIYIMSMPNIISNKIKVIKKINNIDVDVLNDITKEVYKISNKSDYDITYEYKKYGKLDYIDVLLSKLSAIDNELNVYLLNNK